MAIKSPKFLTNNLFNLYGRGNTSTPLTSFSFNPQLQFPQNNLSLQTGSKVDTSAIQPKIASGGILPSLGSQTLATGQINSSQGQSQIQGQPGLSQIQPEISNAQLGNASNFNTQNFQDFIKQYREITAPTPEQKAQIEQSTATLGKLGSLYDQMAALQAPPQVLQDINTQILTQEKALRDFTEKTRQQTIPQGIIEGQVQQAQTLGPIARALTDLLTSRSILSQQREAQQTALQAQAGALGNQFNLQQALYKLQGPAPIPPGVLEKFIAPQIPTSVQEFGFAQKNPQFAEFLKTGKRDQEQQQFLNDVKLQQLQIALQNSQSLQESKGIQNQIRELTLLQLQNQIGGGISPEENAFKQRVNTLSAPQRDAAYSVVGTIKTGKDLIDLLNNGVSTGIIAGRFGRLRSKITGGDPSFNQFQALSTQFTASLIKAISGVQVSDKERQFLLDSLPDANKPMQTNIDNIKSIAKNLGNKYETQLGIKFKDFPNVIPSLEQINQGQTSTGNKFKKQ